MPTNGPFRLGIAPQISISSPEDPNSSQCEYGIGDENCIHAYVCV